MKEGNFSQKGRGSLTDGGTPEKGGIWGRERKRANFGD